MTDIANFLGDTAQPVLELRGLSIAYGGRHGGAELRAVDAVSLSIAPGEAYGLIGESGSGKSSLAYALLRYSDASRVEAEALRFKGEDLLTLPAERLQALRGRRIGMVYQNPMSALNPVMRVGRQIDEVFEQHERLGPRAARERTVALLREVRFGDDATAIAERYPHQLSGGQQQRIVIAMAIACRPELLVLDEPTTGLDVTTEAAILELLAELRGSLGCSLLFISHNLAVVAKLCDRIGVLYAGRLVEQGPVTQLLTRPRHPYTRGLLGAAPTLAQRRSLLAAIPGRLPDLRQPPEAACPFRSRCGQATPACAAAAPPWRQHPQGHGLRCHFDLEDVAPQAATVPQPRPLVQLVTADFPPPQRLLSVRGLSQRYGAGPGLLRRFARPAPWMLQDVNLDVDAGRTTAIVGESGSGKTTLARCLAGLLRSDAGLLSLNGQPLAGPLGQRSRSQRQAVQLVFQNPEATLNPRHTVLETLSRPLRLYRLADGAALRRRCIELLEQVNLDASYLQRLPQQLSGGEKQRVAIARAFAAEPALIICDEPTSALDISVQAAILNQLAELQRARGTAYLFISHDLAVVRHIADKVLVMQRGRVVEQGPTEAVFDHPREAYTRELIAAVPQLPERQDASPAHCASR